jgi:hypothetical protein
MATPRDEAAEKALEEAIRELLDRDPGAFMRGRMSSPLESLGMAFSGLGTFGAAMGAGAFTFHQEPPRKLLLQPDGTYAVEGE